MGGKGAERVEIHEESVFGCGCCWYFYLVDEVLHVVDAQRLPAHAASWGVDGVLIQGSSRWMCTTLLTTSKI